MAATPIVTLSLHDALPISAPRSGGNTTPAAKTPFDVNAKIDPRTTAAHHRYEHQHKSKNRKRDRKSTRLNSSHVAISYAVFCLKKKKKHYHRHVSYIYN